ncbi:MAG: hypothetical protein SynsKO_05330 [Synoicihabitans sp.]
MIIDLTTYLFKGPTEYARGIDYLKETYLPAKQASPGFISGLIAENGPDSVAVLLRFERLEDIKAAAAEREAHRAFVALLAARPEHARGPNLAQSEGVALPA